MQLKYIKTEKVAYFKNEEKRKYRVNLRQKDKTWEVCKRDGTWLKAQNQKELEQAYFDYTYLKFICAKA